MLDKLLIEKALKFIIAKRDEELVSLNEYNGFNEQDYKDYTECTDQYEQALVDLKENDYVEKNDYIRLAADFDNYKKRNAKAELNAYDRGSKNVIESLLPLYDDMERLLNSIKGSVDEKTLSGFEMILENFEKTLLGFECKKIDCKIGDKFDVNMHEAIAVQPISVDQTADNVVNIYQSGWMFNGKLLRPTKVVIGK